MHLFKSACSLALFASLALGQKTQIMNPSPGSTVTAGSNITVQVGMEGSDEVDVVAIVIGLAQCNDGKCYSASEVMGNILYQESYPQQSRHLQDNYNVTVPESFSAGKASLNVINFYMYGSEFIPAVDYLSQDVTVVAGG